MTISEWLMRASENTTVDGVCPSRLDAELILAHVLGVERTYLVAHDDQELSNDQQAKAGSFLDRRITGEPLAYIVGYREFYGRDFIVTPEVLIPRPESEQLVESAIGLITKPSAKIIDVGCGSGCLGISLALELSALQAEVTLSDISPAALDIAQANADKFNLELELIKSNLLNQFIDQKFDLIIANLPYVDPSWDFISGIDHEPKLALYAEAGGLELIFHLIEQIAKHQLLTNDGWLILESDPSQQNDIKTHLQRHNFKNIRQTGYATAAKLN